MFRDDLKISTLESRARVFFCIRNSFETWKNHTQHAEPVGLTVDEIAATVAIGNRTVKRALAALTDEKLITVHPAPSNRRAYEVNEYQTAAMIAKLSIGTFFFRYDRLGFLCVRVIAYENNLVREGHDVRRYELKCTADHFNVFLGIEENDELFGDFFLHLKAAF